MAEHRVRKFAAMLAVLCAVCALSACGQNQEDVAVTAPAVADEVATPSAIGNGDTTEPGSSIRAVVAETLAYAEVDENLVKGYFVFPQDMLDSLPAIILIHEWWGLDDRARELAERIAGQGFVVLAIDLFDGQTAVTPDDARLLMLKVVEEPKFAVENIRQAYDWVLATTGAIEVGVVGYGFGGGWSLNAAIELPDKLDAAVMFYGQVSDNEEMLSRITAPLLAIFGADDNVIPAESIVRFETALQNTGTEYEIESYPEAKGGFSSAGNHNYNNKLALQSWDRMLEFLHRHLNSDKED